MSSGTKEEGFTEDAQNDGFTEKYSFLFGSTFIKTVDVDNLKINLLNDLDEGVITIELLKVRMNDNKAIQGSSREKRTRARVLIKAIKDVILIREGK